MKIVLINNVHITHQFIIILNFLLKLYYYIRMFFKFMFQLFYYYLQILHWK